jgi:hypothetical protein
VIASEQHERGNPYRGHLTPHGLPRRPKRLLAMTEKQRKEEVDVPRKFFKIDKQTIEPIHRLTLSLFLKNGEQTKQAGFQNLSKALTRSCLKTKKRKKFWPVQNFTRLNQPLAENSGQNSSKPPSKPFAPGRGAVYNFGQLHMNIHR